MNHRVADYSERIKAARVQFVQEGRPIVFILSKTKRIYIEGVPRVPEAY